jgi:type VI secretion system protein ImpK
MSFDPFSDEDRKSRLNAERDVEATRLIPTPGMRAPDGSTTVPGALDPMGGAARRPFAAAQRSTQTPLGGDRFSDTSDEVASPDALTSSRGLNPLVALANPLLAAVPQIRATTDYVDPAALKKSLAHDLREFETAALKHGTPPERVMAARYILCTLIDEVAASTPWGGSGAWGAHSLLVMFHNEASGGEKVFQLMAKLAETPSANRDLLELIYVALCLGFQGRYGAVNGGAAQLEAVRDRLAQILKKERGDYPQPLAEHWRGQAFKARSLLSWLPLWVTGAVAAVLLLGIYLLLSSWLAAKSDPTYGQIQSLRLLPPAPVVTQPAPTPRLAQFLSSEIRANLVAVRDDLDRSVITIRGDGLFEPGSASLSADREALMKRIAEALAQVQGQVLVTGHTDNQPIASLRFPSNWHLSEERAKSVRDILVSRGVVITRVAAEGRADGEPVVANDTPANRALNRRVEVTLIAAKTAEKVTQSPTEKAGAGS